MLMEPSLYGYSLDDFREEAKELLARAEVVLSEVRQSPHDIEKINALFRIIHSLKGSAAYTGLADVNAFAHLYEAFLGDLRNSKYKDNPDVTGILIRARDYLYDLIFQPQNAGVLKIDEAVEPMQQLAGILNIKRVTGNKGHVEAPLGAGAANSSQEPQVTSLTTQDPSRMGQNDVIRVTVTNNLKGLYSCLKESSAAKESILRFLVKLEDSVLWAFGDESPEMMNPFAEMKRVVSGDIGPNELIALRKGFNSLAIAIKRELAVLDGNIEVRDQGEVREDHKKKISADEIRGASKDEIVMLSLGRHIDSLYELIGGESPDVPQIKRVLSRLSDLNKWAFNEDESVGALLRGMEDILRRPYDHLVAQDIRVKASAVATLFTGKTEKQGPGTGDRSSEVVARHPLPLQELPREIPFNETKVRGGVTSAPPSSGPTLKVRSDEVEALITTIGGLTGIDPKEYERLQAQALQLRMVQVGELFSRFRKVVRDLSGELGREMDIEISGESVKLDKAIADRLNEPIMHMIRNAAGHGLESPEERRLAGKGPAGLIRLSAVQEGGQIIIEVADNGRGISLEKVRKRGIEMGLIKKGDEDRISEKAVLDLIFMPGFSTMKEADMVSGRGVGMDVVREVVASLQGSVMVDTKEGIGTTFRLQLPLTLAIIKGMVLEQGANRIALPSAFVDRVITMTEEEMKSATVMDNDRPCLDLVGEGEIIPVMDMARVFGLEDRSRARCVVLVKGGIGQKVALVVDSAVGRQPLMVKPLDRFAENRFFSSAAFADNRLVLILNTPSLMSA